MCALASRPRPRVSFLTPLDRPWSELVARWRRLEDAGAGRIWVSDHLFNQQRPGEPWFGGWPSLAGLASVTTRVRIGMLVSPPALHVAATLAKQIVTVDHMSGGRLDVGLGAGGSSLDGELASAPRLASAERLKQFAGFVESLDRLLVPEGYGSLGGAPALQPTPVQSPRPPFTIAGRSKVALQLVARYATRWNFYSTESSEGLDRALHIASRLGQRLDGECSAIGRDPAEIARSLLFRNAPLAGHPLPTPELLRGLKHRFSEAGIDELVFFYPPDVHFPDATDDAALLKRVIVA